MATTRPCQVSPFYLFLGSSDYSLVYEGGQYRASLFAVGIPMGFGSYQLRLAKGSVSPACCVGHARFKNGMREPRLALLCTEASGWLLSCPLACLECSARPGFRIWKMRMWACPACKSSAGLGAAQWQHHCCLVYQCQGCPKKELGPDCVQVEPALKRGWPCMSVKDVCPPTAKSEKNLIKKIQIMTSDKNLKVTAVPTLFKYGTVQKLVKPECLF